MNDTHHVRQIEVFDVSAVAFALLGARIEYEIRPAHGTTHWFEVFVEGDDDPFVISLIERAVGAANSTPMLEIKYMASCCGLGRTLQDCDLCSYCGAHKVTKKTGEPPWRVPEQRSEPVGFWTSSPHLRDRK